MSHAAPPAVLASLTDAADGGLGGKPGDRVDQTRAYIESLLWADTVKFASIDYNLKSGNDSARVHVVPSMVAHEVDWRPAMGIHGPAGNGHFVARIYNVQGKKIPELGMMENDTGYVWIGERAGAKRGAAIYVIGQKGNALRHQNLTVNGFCPGQHPGPKVRSTLGYDCGGGDATFPKEGTTAQLISAHPYAGTQGLWISCKGGCCEVILAT